MTQWGDERLHANRNSRFFTSFLIYCEGGKPGMAPYPLLNLSAMAPTFNTSNVTTSASGDSFALQYLDTCDMLTPACSPRSLAIQKFVLSTSVFR